MTEKRLTPKEAYLAMYAFLDAQYERCPTDELGILLGGMSLLVDGDSADPAYMAEWHEAVEKVLTKKVNAALELGKNSN